MRDALDVEQRPRRQKQRRALDHAQRIRPHRPADRPRRSAAARRRARSRGRVARPRCAARRARRSRNSPDRSALASTRTPGPATARASASAASSSPTSCGSGTARWSSPRRGPGVAPARPRRAGEPLRTSTSLRCCGLRTSWQTIDCDGTSAALSAGDGRPFASSGGRPSGAEIPTWRGCPGPEADSTNATNASPPARLRPLATAMG